MKKIISLIICAAMVCSCVVFADDYEDHWAYKQIEYLKNKGIISGDSNGMRPNDSITRAEFAKVLNLNFSLTKKTDKQINDVTPDKWYYDHMLIAYGEGYMLGDSMNNINPEKNLTRSEAAVILKRILNCENLTSDVQFKDHDEIPEWAKSSVYTLVARNLLNGYEDGTFRPNNDIKRGEIFFLITVLEEKLTEDANQENVTEKPTVSSSSNILKGGQGGSSGGAVSSDKLYPPSIRKIDDEYNIYWDKVAGAASYEIKIVRVSDNNKKSYITSELSLNLKPFMDDLTIDNRTADEYFTVTVKSIGRNSSSAESTAENVKREYPAARLTEITCDITMNSDYTENVTFKWEKTEYTNNYELYFDYNDGMGYTPLSYTVNGTSVSAQIPDSKVMNLTSSHKMKIKALGNSSEIIDSETLEKEISIPLFGGEENGYNLIYNKRHFNNIKSNPAGKYALKTDIDLSDGYTPIKCFSGMLIGTNTNNGSTAQRTIKLNIESSDDNTGLFETISGNVVVSNITLTGTVKGKGYTGALFGRVLYDDTNKATVTADAKLIDIINMAEVTGNGNYVGGIGGLFNAAANNSNLNGLINRGNVTNISGIGVGGIFGYANNAVVNKCANSGDITGSGNYAGGIVGESYSVYISECHNSGNVHLKRGNSIGGILGFFQYRPSTMAKSIINCYNSGKISSDNEIINIAGIMGNTASRAEKNAPVIEACYNAGNLINGENFVDMKKNIYGGDTTYIHTVTDCYFIADATDNNIENTGKPVSASDMESLDILTGLSKSIWETGVNQNYKYPTIIGLEHIVKPKNLEMSDIQIEHLANGVFLKFNKVDNAQSYHVTVYKGADTTPIGTTSYVYDESDSYDLTAYFTEYGNYTVKVKAIGDGAIYLDSAEKSLNYSHTKFVISAPDNLTNTNYLFDTTETYSFRFDEVVSPLLKEYEIEIYADDDIVPCHTFTTANTEFDVAMGSEHIPYANKLKISLKAIDTNDEKSEATVLTVDTLFGGGNGEENNPYKIYTERHFKNIQEENAKSYVIMRDITFTPSTGAIVDTFKGSITGVNAVGEEEVRTLTLSISSSGENVGLFGKVDGAFVIKNIKTSGSVLGSKNVGGIFGTTGAAVSNEATINHCENSAEVTGSYAGGIGGNLIGAIKVSGLKNTGNITASGNAVGGVFGYMLDATASYLVNTGNITSFSPYTGGLIGYFYNGLLEKSYNAGNVTSGTQYVGGIAGIFYSKSGKFPVNISNCYNSGTVTCNSGSSEKVGGILGSCPTRTDKKEVVIENCYNSGEIYYRSGTILDRTKGIVGEKGNNNTITNCYYLNDTSGTDTGLGTPLSSDDVKMVENYTGFDRNIWLFDGINYPQLRN